MSDTVDGNIQKWKETIEGGYFDKHHHYTDRPYFVPPALSNLVYGGMALDARGSCLEIGVGYGRVARFAVSQFRRVYGCDISDKHFPSLLTFGIEPSVVSGTGSLEGYDDNQFDLVYSMNVLQHLTPDQVKLYLKESWRVTKSGGYIFHYLLHLHGQEGGTWSGPSLDFTYSIRPETVTAILDDYGIPSKDVKLEPDPNKRMTYIWLIARKELRG